MSNAHAALAALRNTVANLPKQEPKTIPVGYFKLVCFDRAQNAIGRMTMPAEQAIAKFNDLVKNVDRPTSFGYATLYGWVNQEERIAYCTHNGRVDVDYEAIEALLPKDDAPAPTTKPTKTRASKTRK